MSSAVVASEALERKRDAPDRGHDALLGLSRALDRDGYRFVTPTPGTHARVVGRADRQEARNVRDVLGWSLPFRRDVLPAELFDLLDEADALQRLESGRFKAGVRVSSVRDRLFVHSAYPTEAKDSVFLGPDSCRFADLIVAETGALRPGARIMDYAAGAGVGGVTAARAAPGAVLTQADVNRRALRFAAVNAASAGLDHREVEASRPSDVGGSFDLIVTHPPFMMDEGRRRYRDGGDLHGARLSLDWALDALEMLAEGGRFVMHTGVAIVDGQDALLERLRGAIDPARFEWGYRELDPDIFSEELDTAPYAYVERIAAVGVWAERRAA